MNMKRAREESTTNVRMVPYDIQQPRYTPMALDLLSRVFPMNADAILDMHKQTLCYILGAMNWFEIFASHSDYDGVNYMSDWIPLALRTIPQWTQDVRIRDSFLRKQKRWSRHLQHKLLKNGEAAVYEASLHSWDPEAGFKEYYWPMLFDATLEDVNRLRFVVDSDLLNAARARLSVEEEN